MRFLADYWRNVRGPLWATVLGGIATAVPLALAIINSGRVWMWLAIALAVVVALQVAGAYREWRRKQDSTPRLSLVEQGVKKGTVFEDTRRPFSVAWVLVANLTHSDRPEAEARNVQAAVSYFDADGSVVYRGQGRWAETDQPSTRPLGFSTEDLEETTFRTNQVPQTLEVAIKYDDEPIAYPFGNENYERWRASQEPSLALPGLELPRITRIEIGVIGSGVVMKHRQFFLRVTDAGLEIEPREP